ncbi:C-C motif chemokine 14-like [Molossus nigricans]
MRIPAAALSFLILSAALGTLTHGFQSLELPDHESRMVVHQLEHINQGLHRPSECCFSYTPRKIRCVFMEDYFQTTGGCSQPGVIFISRRGQRVCANPLDGGVQNCIENLNLDLEEKLNLDLEKNLNLDLDKNLNLDLVEKLRTMAR